MVPDQAVASVGLAAEVMGDVHLPVGIVSTGDVRRLRRELAFLEDTLDAMRLKTNAPVAKLPRLSRVLEEFAATNRLNLLLPDDRARSREFFDTVLAASPTLHVSFATEPSRKFMTEIMLWLRGNLDPNVLVEVGMEPSIAAGCILRTANRQFDFSLRRQLSGKRDLLRAAIEKAGK